MTSEETSPRRRSKFFLQNAEGRFLRMAIIQPGARGASLDTITCTDVHVALVICTREAADKLRDAIGMHYVNRPTVIDNANIWNVIERHEVAA